MPLVRDMPEDTSSRLLPGTATSAAPESESGVTMGASAPSAEEPTIRAVNAKQKIRCRKCAVFIVSLPFVYSLSTGHAAMNSSVECPAALDLNRFLFICKLFFPFFRTPACEYVIHGRSCPILSE